MNPVDAKYLIEAIEEKGFSPQGKEAGFISSVENLIEQGKYLSSKQSSWLQAIYRKSQQGTHQRKQFV